MVRESFSKDPLSQQSEKRKDKAFNRLPLRWHNVIIEVRVPADLTFSLLPLNHSSIPTSSSMTILNYVDHVKKLKSMLGMTYHQDSSGSRWGMWEKTGFSNPISLIAKALLPRMEIEDEEAVYRWPALPHPTPRTGPEILLLGIDEPLLDLVTAPTSTYDTRGSGPW